MVSSDVAFFLLFFLVLIDSSIFNGAAEEGTEAIGRTKDLIAWMIIENDIESLDIVMRSIE